MKAILMALVAALVAGIWMVSNFIASYFMEDEWNTKE